MALFDFCEKCYPKLCYCRQGQKKPTIKKFKGKFMATKKVADMTPEELEKNRAYMRQKKRESRASRRRSTSEQSGTAQKKCANEERKKWYNTA